MKNRKLFAITAIFVFALWGVRAQTLAPGGVNNPNYTWVAWLQSENYDNGTWTNSITGTVGNFIKQDQTPPKINEGYNFHPSVQFPFMTGNSYGRYWMRSENNNSMTTSDNITTIFVLKRSADNNSYDHLLAFNSSYTTGAISWYSLSNISWTWQTIRRNFGAVTEGIIVLDNANTNAANIKYHYNGANSGSVTGTTDGSYAANQQIAIASGENDDSDGYYGFEGTIQEIIILKANGTNNHLEAADLQKIHSYLAIKYGITLNNNEDYVNSTGDAVWDRTANASYNQAIFGIARDDADGLYQKQSANTLGPVNAIFVGNSLKPLNIQNSGTLSNGQYVMIGTSGTGSVDLTYTFDNGYTFYNGPVTASNGLNYRNGIVYKAQLTDPAQTQGNVSFTVKLAVTGSAPYCLVSKNANFIPSDTKIYPVNGGVATVELSSEFQYIDFAGFTSRINQAPGGVTAGLKLWLRADDDASITLENLPSTDSKLRGYPDLYGATHVTATSEWKDLIRNHTYSYQMGGNIDHLIPVYQQSNYMTNYHPAIHFWGNGINSTWLGNTSGIWPSQYPTNNKHSAFFVVNNDFGTHTWIYTMMFGSASLNTNYRGPGYGVEKRSGNIVGRFRTDATEGYGSADLFKPGATSILGYHHSWPNTSATPSGNSSVKFRFNGLEDTRANIAAGNFGLNQESMIGKGYIHDRVLQGVMSEVIMYDDEISETDVAKIESYLAIKYGITLHPSTTSTNRFNYMFSDGMSFWNGDVAGTDKYAVFYNRIAAVIRDDAANLHNSHSHSTDVGSLLHMGVAGKKLGTSGAETGKLDYDTEAVVWGDDNAAGETEITGDVCGDFRYIFNRKWLVHKKTENDRPITMLVGAQDNTGTQLGGVNDPVSQKFFDRLGEGYDVVLLVAESPEDIDNRNFKAIIPMSYIDKEHQCQYTFADEETYITFAYRINNKGCVGETSFEGNLEYKWSSQWERYNYGNDNNMGTISKPAYDLGLGVNITTSVTYDNGIYGISYYPQSVNSPSSGSLEIRRIGGAVNQKVTVKMVFNYPVIPVFSISDIDAFLNAFESVKVTGACNGESYLPTLSYGSNANTSHFKINGNTATAFMLADLPSTNKDGRLDVRFEGGVTEVTIEYTIIHTINSYISTLVISPISIMNVPPPPPVNEDGLSFVKDVKRDNISTCEDVEYSFYIQNTNCDTMFVNFSDDLPQYLNWMSLSLDEVNDLHNIHISTNDYENKQHLQIDSLAIPGTSTLRFTATATFDAAPSGDYSNRASIDYNRIINNVSTPVILESLDRETLGEKTTFHATQALRSSKAQLISSISPERYGANALVEVSLAVTNPNTATPFTNIFLDIDWDAGFSYEDGSLSVSGASSGITMLTPDNNRMCTFAGANATTGFTLQPGTTVIKFKLRAPSTPEPALDNEGNIIQGKNAALNVNYEFTMKNDDPCEYLTVTDLKGRLTMEYIKMHILLNQHVTTRIKKY
ncbi:MAG: hypothetical protein LBD80_00455 [Tannerella sp.]|jgi:hypothetical protein|nr:hypothetical protein [Tannerella sp.]